MNEHIDTKDAQAYTQDSGWVVVSHECEYEAWTTEERFRRVYHLAPGELIVVVPQFVDALLLADRVNGIVVAVGQDALQPA